MPALELKDLPRQLPPAPRRQHTTDEVDYSHMKYRFLLVDDVFSNRKILHMLLKKRGVECEMAEDGVQCLQMVEARGDTYSLIFMDNMMPKMGGVQTTKRLREMGFERMIIGLTGNTLLDEIIEFEESGVDVVFPKPVNLRQIDTLLKFMQSNGLQTTINDRSAVKPDGTRERNIMSSYFPSNSARTR
jgi:CheY-like chemotaxis protein